MKRERERERERERGGDDDDDDDDDDDISYFITFVLIMPTYSMYRTIQYEREKEEDKFRRW